VDIPFSNNLIHKLNFCESLALALANLFGVAAALGDEVVAIYPTMVSTRRI
jgi:hypothetical protein